MSPSYDEKIEDTIRRMHVGLIVGCARKPVPNEVVVNLDLTQDNVDAWLLKGSQGLVQFLDGRTLSSPMQQAVEDAIPEIEKAIEMVSAGHNHPLPTPEAYLSRMLPLLIRGLMMRLTYSSAPMSNENQTSLHYLLGKLNEKSTRNKGGPQKAPS